VCRCHAPHCGKRSDWPQLEGELARRMGLDASFAGGDFAFLTWRSATGRTANGEYPFGLDKFFHCEDIIAPNSPAISETVAPRLRAEVAFPSSTPHA
jgi:hypothetical protein